MWLVQACTSKTKSFRSPWDGRKWEIRKHITYTSENVVYLIICTLHDNCWYLGSSDNARRRWTRYKYDWNHGNRTCTLASHGQDVPHPDDPQLNFVTILPIDTVRKRKLLLKEEVWWQENIGVHRFGLNKRKDLATVSRNLKRCLGPPKALMGPIFFQNQDILAQVETIWKYLCKTNYVILFHQGSEDIV